MVHYCQCYLPGHPWTVNHWIMKKIQDQVVKCSMFRNAGGNTFLNIQKKLI